MFHILIVDDDKNIRYVMKELLQANGYVAFTAKDAESALSLFETEHTPMYLRKAKRRFISTKKKWN